MHVDRKRVLNKTKKIHREFSSALKGSEDVFEWRDWLWSFLQKWMMMLEFLLSCCGDDTYHLPNQS
jgi:hypothetical protein